MVTQLKEWFECQQNEVYEKWLHKRVSVRKVLSNLIEYLTKYIICSCFWTFLFYFYFLEKVTTSVQCRHRSILYMCTWLFLCCDTYLTVVWRRTNGNLFNWKQHRSSNNSILGKLLRETGWSAYGFFPAQRHHLELNGTELDKLA